jgi:hypothetical protein
MAFLLTWHGTLLCRHRQRGDLVHRPLPAASDDVDRVMLDLPIELLQPGFSHHLQATLPELPITLPDEWRDYRVQWGGDQRTISLRRDNAFLSAEPDGDRVTLFRTLVGGWESFLALSQTDLDVVCAILASPWLVRSSGVLAERRTMSDLFHLQAGEVVADLRFQVPFDLANWPRQLTLLRDGWRIDQLCQFRPLVYYTLLGGTAVREQFALSIQSLFGHGQYRGDIAVLTDLSTSELMPFLRSGTGGHYIVVPSPAKGPLEVRAARYTIADWRDAWSFQPLLYVDAHTIFDADITPLLHALALSDLMAAPAEYLPPLSRLQPAGSGLLQLDECASDHRQAFDVSVLGIPNLACHAHTLALICRVLANRSILHDRELPDAADRDIANYVSFRSAPVDTSLLSPFVRDASVANPAAPRRGMAQFARVTDAAERTDAMRDYLRRLGTVA